MPEKHYRTKLRRRRKELFVDRFGGKCQLCGYDKCLDSLTFHHVDATTKEFEPSKIISQGTIERAEKELEKCILICRNCHGEIHSEDYDYSYKDLDRLVINWYEKECKFCKKTFKTKKEESIFCSSTCSQLSQRKIQDRPSKEELTELIKIYTYMDLGRKFKVRDNTVRKWARMYDII